MRLLFHGGVIAYRALFNWTSPPMFIGTILALPLFQLFFFLYLGRQLGVADDNYYLVGNTILSATNLCIFGGTMAIANDRRFNTLDHVLLSWRSRTLIFLGRAVPYAGNALLVAAFCLTTSATFLGLTVPARAWFGLIIVLIAASLASAFFGLVIGSIGLRFRDVWLISNSTFALMLLVSDTNVPHSALPGWMQAIGNVVPVTHAASAARDLVGGASIADVAGELALEVVVAVGYAILAGVLLKIFEVEARRSGTFSQM